jgi:hypothetical protein
MSRNKKLIGNNTIIEHIQYLCKMITMAFYIEWINRGPFVKYKPVFKNSERSFLLGKGLKAYLNYINIKIKC